MIATKRAADTLIILIVLLLAWQALHQVVGATALPGPVPTLAYLAKLVPSERFAENAWATLVCFFYALMLRMGLGSRSACGWGSIECPGRSASRFLSHSTRCRK